MGKLTAENNPYSLVGMMARNQQDSSNPQPGGMPDGQGFGQGQNNPNRAPASQAPRPPRDTGPGSVEYAALMYAKGFLKIYPAVVADKVLTVVTSNNPGFEEDLKDRIRGSVAAIPPQNISKTARALRWLVNVDKAKTHQNPTNNQQPYGGPQQRHQEPQYSQQHYDQQNYGEQGQQWVGSGARQTQEVNQAPQTQEPQRHTGIFGGIFNRHQRPDDKLQQQPVYPDQGSVEPQLLSRPGYHYGTESAVEESVRLQNEQRGTYHSERPVDESTLRRPRGFAGLAVNALNIPVEKPYQQVSQMAETRGQYTEDQIRSLKQDHGITITTTPDGQNYVYQNGELIQLRDSDHEQLQQLLILSGQAPIQAESQPREQLHDQSSGNSNSQKYFPVGENISEISDQKILEMHGIVLRKSKKNPGIMLIHDEERRVYRKITREDQERMEQILQEARESVVQQPQPSRLNQKLNSISSVRR